MSRGEETDERTTGDDHAVSGEPVGLGKAESAGDVSEPAPRHAVVISGDGSAAIDGEPVPVTEGAAVDAAILDTLHGYARDRNTTVTATISDPSAGYVAFVEVAPDGSSSLLEQQQEQVVEPAEHAQSYGPVAGTGLSGAGAGAGADDDDDVDLTEADDLDPAEAEADDESDDESESTDGDDDDDFDVEAYTLEQQRQRGLTGPPPPPPPPPRLAARPSSRVAPGNGSRQSDDEYGSPGLLHKPLVVGPVALGVAALVIVPLVVLGSGASDDGGHQKQAARSSAETSGIPQAEEAAPTASSSASRLPPLPSVTVTSPSAGPKASKSAKAPKSGGGVGGVGGVTVTVTAKPPRATVTAKPRQDTAATAVNRLHRNDPSGRHICYRAYLSGQGWQKPVCDGTLAGTTSGSHPIKALNIAVHGGDGSSANAFVHDARSTDGRGKWAPQWTAVIGDGKDNYIGSTKSSAPYMTGFAINIGSGHVCRTAKVHGYDWGSSDCADPRPGFIFGGALENTRWLEAVKLWV
ncbi:hypothetical protein ACFZBZ_21670 [Streptomyces sp. NPDC008196]|uniref:hypothetical protein n=1 Tax=Streptomyces sp. NPDC008196 TaxID=3364819 RepID=UPI0036E03006